MKYEAIIVEDKRNLRKALELLLEKYCPEIKIRSSVGSVQDACMYLKSNTVDFVFLNISVPGEDVFAFLQTMQDSQFGVIFTIESQVHLLQAIKANSIDYLIKPFDAVALIQTMRNAILYYELRKRTLEIRNIYQESLVNLQHHFKTGDKIIKKITIPDEYSYKVVNVTDLIFLQSDSNYTILHIRGGKIIVANWPLEEFEKILLNCEFFRISKSTIINLNYLNADSNLEGDSAVLTDGTHLTISRKKLNEFLGVLKPYPKSID